MMRLRLRADLRCPKHPRFSGDDQGAVKAGCPACQDLCTIARMVANVEERVGYFLHDCVPAEESVGKVA
jgi:hypothetical protein